MSIGLIILLFAAIVGSYWAGYYECRQRIQIRFLKLMKELVESDGVDTIPNIEQCIFGSSFSDFCSWDNDQPVEVKESPMEKPFKISNSDRWVWRPPWK